MILKQKKSSILIILILLNLMLISLAFNNQKINIFKADLREKFISLDLGVSSIKNLLDDGSGEIILNKSNKLIILIKKIPSFFYYKLFDKDAIQFEKIFIDIKFKDYQKLMLDRNQAIAADQLSNPSTINATLSHKNNTYKAKIRLKGDLNDHWTSSHRMSFKISLKNEKTILGFNKFAIQKPSSRQHPYDYIYQSMMRDMGNLASVHKFAHIFVNGDSWGIMDIEELMSKELLEKQNRKNSMIVRFSDDRRWFYRTSSEAGEYEDYKLSDPSLYINLYGKKSLKDPHNRQIYSYISKNRLLNNRNIYDVDSFSKAYIMALAWDTMHTLTNSNSRYYFNPYTLKLEPITTDQGGWSSIEESQGDWSSIKESKIDAQYKEILSSQSESYLKNLSNNLQKVEQSITDIEEFLSYPQLMFPVDLRKNSKIVLDNMKKILNNKEKYLISSILLDTEESKLFDRCRMWILNHPYCKPNTKPLKAPILPTKQQSSEFQEHLHIKHYADGTLELYNLLPDNVTVKNILFDNKSFTDKEIIIPSYLLNLKPTILKTPYKGILDDMVTVNTEYQGFERFVNNGITLFKNGIKNPLLTDTSDKFDFVNQLDSKSYVIPRGNWIVNHPIIVEGDLKIYPGVNLQFSDDSYLIVKGSLHAKGDSTNPIVFDSISNSWKGIYVLNADKKSYLKNVNIFNISALEDELLKLTGGITFYKSDVDLEDVRITNVKSEDAINIVNSTFSLNSVFIKDTFSDGLDSDFSDGNVVFSEFSNIGGDALDFSGSNVSINRIKVRNVKDKAISAGEESILNIENSNFSNIGVGVASKDGSSVTMTSSAISKYDLYAAMAYIKKDFYGSPSITLNSCLVSNMNGVSNPYMRQEGANMLIDNVEIQTSNMSIENLYKSSVMSK